MPRGYCPARRFASGTIPNRRPSAIACRVFGNILKCITDKFINAEGQHAPHVGGTPLPSLPAIRRPHLQSVFTLVHSAIETIEKLDIAAMRGMYSLGFTMAVTLKKYRIGIVFRSNSPDFTGNQVGCFIPGDSFIFAAAPVLRISVALGIPINSL